MRKSLALLTIVFLLLTAPAATADSSIVPIFSDLNVSYSHAEKLVLSGKTNLPNGTKISALILQLPEKKGLYTDMPLSYPEEMDVIVLNGAFESWFPSVYEKGLKAGKYAIQIATLPDQTVILGPKNERLAGPGVTTGANGKTFIWEIAMTVPDIPGHRKN